MVIDTNEEAPAGARERLPWLHGATAFVVLTVILAIFRTPRAILVGRFWAEEGVFGSELIRINFIAALTYIYNGTFFVLTSLPVWLVLRAPLEWSALLLTWYGLLVQVIFVLLFRWWARSNGVAPWAILLGVTALLLHPAMYRLSANATNVQWMASLIVFVLLIMPATPLDRRLVTSGGWVIAAGLTGVCSSMLAPAFLIRGILLRSRAHLMLGAILSVTALIQVVMIRIHPPTGRSYAIWPFISLVASSAQTVWVNLVGIPIRIVSGYAGEGGIGPAVVGVVLIVGAATLVGVLCRLTWDAGRDQKDIFLLLGVWLYVSVLNFFGAIGAQIDYLGPIAGERYFVIGITAYVVLCLLVTRNRTRARFTGYALLVWMILLGIGQGFISQFNDEFSHGPNWRDEIARCERNSERICFVRIWPARNPGESPWIIKIPAERFRRVGQPD